MKTHEELLEKFKRRDLMEELGWAACYTRRGYMRAGDADYYSWLALAAYRKIKELTGIIYEYRKYDGFLAAHGMFETIDTDQKEEI